MHNPLWRPPPITAVILASKQHGNMTGHHAGRRGMGLAENEHAACHIRFFLIKICRKITTIHCWISTYYRNLISSTFFLCFTESRALYLHGLCEVPELIPLLSGWCFYLLFIYFLLFKPSWEGHGWDPADISWLTVLERVQTNQQDPGGSFHCSSLGAMRRPDVFGDEWRRCLQSLLSIARSCARDPVPRLLPMEKTACFKWIKSFLEVDV